MRLFIHLPALLLCALSLSPLPASASLDDGLTRLSDVRRGALMFRAEDEASSAGFREVPSLSSEVQIQVTGPIARTIVTQHFVNPSETWAEALYAFPLPENAAVDHLRMRIGERIIEGDIQEKAQARATFEQAKQDGKRTALVEQHRPNLFTSAVANIPPHGEIRIEIEYQQELLWRDEAFSLRFPMAITPRYQPASAEPIENHSQVGQGWSLLPGELPQATDTSDTGRASHNPVSLTVQLQPGFELGEVVSPYHAIAQTREADVTRITLSQGRVPSDRDFVLRWRPKDGLGVQSAFFTQRTDNGDYGLLMLMPPQADFAAGHERAREIIFIIDTSGSMGGEPIRAARAGLLAGLDQLDPSDRFNLIEFNSSTRALFANPVTADAGHLDQARRWTHGLKANGGTEMRPALKLGLGQAQDPAVERLRQIVFITDGAVGNEAQLLSLIHRELGRARLFTVGIGAAPNAHFMTEAAQFGRGSFSYIAHDGEVQHVMQRLFERLDHPALTDLDLKLDQASDRLPNPLPDLYVGEPISVVMKLNGQAASAELQGQLGSRPWTHRLTLNQGAAQSGIDVLWARRKITDWSRQGRRGASADQVRQEITALALKHHLVSEFTSLVAVDKTPVRAPDESLDTHALKSNLPAGMNTAQVGLARGSTPSLWLLLMGGLFTATGVLMGRRKA